MKKQFIKSKREGRSSKLHYVVLMTLLLCLCSFKLTAQNVALSGTVTFESGESVIGATVVVQGTQNGTITDLDGNYVLENVPADGTIEVSYVGVKTQHIKVAGRTKIDVVFKEESITLNEVVAIGYGSMQRKDLTGSVSSITSDDLTIKPGATVNQALQGKTSGVVVQQNNGSPGGTTQIRIRGANSILGDNEPMWVVDGFPVSDANMLNLADIESIDVLKDASATAIYGSRGAAGVIIVTTKKGKAGRTKITYEGKLSMQSLIKKLDMLDAKGYMQLMNLQLKNSGGEEYFSESEIANAGKGTDWQDLMYRNAPLHEHSVNITGGSDKTKFSIGATYFDQRGIMRETNYNRTTVRASIDHDISKIFQVSSSTILSRSGSNSRGGTGGYRGSSLFSSTVVASPTVGPYNEDGTYRFLNHEYPFSVSTLRNPMAMANEIDSRWFKNRIVSNLSLKIKPMKGLVIETSGNVENTEYRSDSYTSTKYPQSEGTAEIDLANTIQFTTNNTATYTLDIDKHSMSAMVGTSYERVTYKPVSVGSKVFLHDISNTYDLGAASDFLTIKPSSNYHRSDLLSYFGRVYYSYDDRYLATLTMRRDGTSKYTEKWGGFPSLALAWRVTSEKFMSNIDWLSHLKLRLGYGQVGNPGIDPYTTIRLLTSVHANVNKDQVVGFDPRESYPGDLKWEIQEQANVGLDLSLFDNRLNLTADYYIKNTKDLLNEVQLPISAGYDYTVKNIGKMRNTGVELQLEAHIIRSKDWNWSLTTNLAFNKNEVVKLYGGQDIKGSTFTQLWVGDYVNIVSEGHPIGSFYGFKFAGYDDDGDMLYFNEGGEKVLSSDLKDADRTFIGNPNPKLTYGINSTLTYKDFSFSFFLQGVEGRDIFSFSMGSTNFDYGYGLNTFKEVLTNHWTPENTNAKYPKLKRDNPYVISDKLIYDGSYLRLRNVELAYSIPTRKLGIPWVSRAQVYVSGQNLFTVTNYPWYDPDVNSRGGSKSINQGIDDYSYPTAKSYTFGVRMEF